MSECIINSKGHNSYNEINESNLCGSEDISLMHKEFHEIRIKLYDLKDKLEQIINVLGGGTIDTFKTPINATSTNDRPVLEPEKMTLGDNLIHLEMMVGESTQRVTEIYHIIGMEPNKRY